MKTVDKFSFIAMDKRFFGGEAELNAFSDRILNSFGAFRHLYILTEFIIQFQAMFVITQHLGSDNLLV